MAQQTWHTILVVGVALFGIYELGASARLARLASRICRRASPCRGIYLEKNERYRLLGRTGSAAAWALLFSARLDVPRRSNARSSVIPRATLIAR